MKDTSLRTDGTRNRESKTGNGIVRIRSRKRKLRYMKRTPNDRQRTSAGILRGSRYGIFLYNIGFEQEKEYPAYAERITENGSGKMQEISSVYAHRISALLQRKLWETKGRKLSGKSIGFFGQQVLNDRKEAGAGTNRKYSGYEQSNGRVPARTNLRMLIESEIVPPKISGYSQVFA